MPETSSDAAHDGILLIQRGWTQGSLLDAASAPKIFAVQTAIEAVPENNDASISPVAVVQWSIRQISLDANDWLIVVSQDCDILKPSKLEPYVEAVRAYWTSNRQIIHDAKRNSVYYFFIHASTEQDKAEEALIADARPRLLIEKEALLRCTPLPSFNNNDTLMLRRFRQWLARRYYRQALEDDLVIAVQQPVVKAVGKLRQTNPLHHTLDSIREVRFFLHNEAAPYQVEILFLYDKENEATLMNEEEVARLGNWLATVLKEGGRAELLSWNIFSTQEISVYDYENAYELPLYQYSLSQDDRAN